MLDDENTPESSILSKSNNLACLFLSGLLQSKKLSDSMYLKEYVDSSSIAKLCLLSSTNNCSNPAHFKAARYSYMCMQLYVQCFHLLMYVSKGPSIIFSIFISIQRIVFLHISSPTQKYTIKMLIG